MLTKAIHFHTWNKLMSILKDVQILIKDGSSGTLDMPTMTVIIITMMDKNLKFSLKNQILIKVLLEEHSLK